jgi:DMSO reductase anchor subunit
VAAECTKDEEHWMSEQYRNRPLVAFTVLGPASVGALLGTLVLEAGAPDPYPAIGTVAAVLLALVAVLLSLAHLDKPGKAYRAVRRFPSSPLSREIVFFAVYTAAAAVCAAAALAGARIFWPGIIAVVFGAAAIAATAHVYVIPGRPAWHHWSTFAAFAGTSLSLGPALALALAGPRWPALLDGSAALALRGLIVTGVALAAVALWARTTRLKHSMTNRRSGSAVSSFDPVGLWTARIVVGLLVPAAVLILAPTSPTAVAMMVLALLAGETADRTLFFAGAAPRPLGREIPGAR